MPMFSRKVVVEVVSAMSLGRIAAESASVSPSFAKSSVVQSLIAIRVAGGVRPTSWCSQSISATSVDFMRPTSVVMPSAVVLVRQFRSVGVRWADDRPYVREARAVVEMM